MFALLRRNPGFFLLLTAAGLALRLFFFFKFPVVAGDALVYGDIAKNWLHHGIYGLTDNGHPVATYIRLPGYPAFLAIVFAIFGDDRYRVVLSLQLLADVSTCFAVCAIAWQVWDEPTAKWAFALAVLCPFLANYAAVAITETLSLCGISFAFLFFVFGLKRENRYFWICCGTATAVSILLRPDQGLLIVSFVAYLGWRWLRSWQQQRRVQERPRESLRAALLLASVALFPLLPWTARNWHTFHRFQPLVPRAANGPDEFAASGFSRWVGTWCIDYVSTADFIWKADVTNGEPLDISLLPNRAFDSQEQRAETQRVFDHYNAVASITREVDAEFEQIARERIAKSWFRYHLWMPMLRLADMWLRPRVEMLPVELRWWEWQDDWPWNLTVVVFGLLNIFYLLAAAVGFHHAWAEGFSAAALSFIILRCLLLGTVENPEPRYTLEPYPLILAMAAAAISHCRRSGWSDIRNCVRKCSESRPTASRFPRGSS